MNYPILGSVILSVISPVSYTKSMLKGVTKPHRTTRLIVWLASISGFLGVLSSTNLPGKIFAIIFLVRATYLLIMSVKYGIGGSSKLDLTCFTIAVLAILTYSFTRNGLVTISLAILADFIGFIPAFAKTFKSPKSEEPIFYILEAAAAIMGVIAIWSLRVDVLFPVYFLMTDLIMLSLIFRKKLFCIINNHTPQKRKKTHIA